VISVIVHPTFLDIKELVHVQLYIFITYHESEPSISRQIFSL